MKPTDCWYCEYVGKCNKIYLHTCNNYKKFEYDTVHKICDIIGISKRQFYRYKDKYGLKLSSSSIAFKNTYVSSVNVMIS